MRHWARFMGMVAWLLASNVVASEFLTDYSLNATPRTVEVSITDLGNDLLVSLEVLHETGDLRGFFFNVANEALLPDLSITGADVGATVLGANSVQNPGPGATIEPLGPFDAAVMLNSPGVGHDDLRQTSFIISSTGANAGILDLDVSDVVAPTVGGDPNLLFGVRLTTQGDKLGVLAGVRPTPEPMSLAAWGVALAIAGFRRRARA